METSDRSDDDPPDAGELPEGLVSHEAPLRLEDPDQDIVDLIATGNLDRAIRMLMDRHGRALFRYCCTEMRNESAADDVHQIIFIQAHRDLRSFAGRSTIRSWLYGIARYRILDAKKRKKIVKVSRPLQESDELIPDPEQFDLERLDDARLVPALRDCLERLPEQTRTALVLRWQQGFSYEELAELQRDRPGTIRVRVSRALKALRRCIELETRGPR